MTKKVTKAGDGDKRSVSTDALATLGTIIDEHERRDAIHLAVEPVKAMSKLFPGSHVTADGKQVGGWFEPGEHKEKIGKPVGIVDPFLTRPVEVGEWFWLIVYPRQIHSLRHVWTHPDFPDAAEVLGEAPNFHEKAKAIRMASEIWLRKYCEENDCPPYEYVVEKVLDSIGEEYVHFDGMDAHGNIPPEFWDHLEVVTNTKIAHRDRPEGFSCSC